MFAADAQLDVAACGTSAFHAHAHQRADALAVDRHERVCRIDFGIGIGMHERTRVITADAERGLRQVVGAE